MGYQAPERASITRSRYEGGGEGLRRNDDWLQGLHQGRGESIASASRDTEGYVVEEKTRRVEISEILKSRVLPATSQLPSPGDLSAIRIIEAKIPGEKQVKCPLE